MDKNGLKCVVPEGEAVKTKMYVKMDAEKKVV